jgi:hypothetical protein
MMNGRHVAFRLVLLALAAAVLGANGDATISQAAATPGWAACQASDQAWVRRAILALQGRKSWGQGEVNAYEDEVRTAPGGKKQVAAVLMSQDDFRLHWSDVLMDALHVARTEDKSQKACYDVPSGPPLDDGSLAAWVRDHDAVDTASRPFRMHELLGSALVQDDLSVVYRANLFAMMGKPIYGANLDDVGRERSRRQDFGGVFDAVYIHRDLVCLGCHNSEYSKSFDPDPQKSRAWPVPGLFERALFGASNGMHAPAEEAAKGTDFLRAHSMLRYDGVGDAPHGVAPYGWDAKSCGAFGHPTADPLLGVDTYFGKVRGEGASVWELEASLHRGVDAVATHGLRVEHDQTLDDPDEAFAYLVAENIVDKVWSEVMGGGLTIANYFPRNAVQRDTLKTLTDHFARNHFSLRTLLEDIVLHPAFNLLPPSAGCGASAYDVPNLYNPWTISSEDPALRGNGVGDSVFAISSRSLVRSLHRAMQWPDVAEYPAPATFEVSLGFFIKDADPGYRGLDFQGQLAWEAAYGSCAAQAPGDFVAQLVQQAAVAPGATVGDALVALKDRLLGEPWIDATERPMLEALLGDDLGSRELEGLDDKLRKACGVFVSSPEFMLGGTVPDDSRAVPKLTPEEHSQLATCRLIAAPRDGSRCDEAR